MSFRLLQCLGIKNPCYTHYKGINLVPEGIVVHTTDANNKRISRYDEPAAGQTSGMSDNGETVSASKMSAILGDNVNNNSWNRSGATAAVHAFIGTVANGSIAVCQFLPWQSPCWGSGSGPNGTVNGCYNGKAKAPLYVQFEICEGPHSDLDYCRKTYQTAVELCAYLIKMFPTIKPEKIFGHKEIYEQGKSDVRADPIKYWNACKSGYTMDGFRADVKRQMAKTEMPFTDVKDGKWYYDDVLWAYENGITSGVSKDKFGVGQPCTREQVMAMLHNYDKARRGG